MKNVMDFIYPSRCKLCGSADVSTVSYLCERCVADIRLNLTACQMCAVPLSRQMAGRDDLPMICGKCITNPPNFDRCWAPFVYAQPLEWMIHQLKFNERLYFIPLLSALMAEKITSYMALEDQPDAIIPMPLHKNRLRQRGFNQSYLLIKHIAKTLGIIIDSSLCHRVRDTEHQTGKSAQQRALNIKHAFCVSQKHEYRHVVIFDDVVTTGSSVTELSKVLKRSGIKRVDVWCLARAEKTTV